MQDPGCRTDENMIDHQKEDKPTPGKDFPVPYPDTGYRIPVSRFWCLTPIQHRGLTVFCLLILGVLVLRFWSPLSKSFFENKKIGPTTGITIELKGEVHHPALLSYSKAPTLMTVIRDGGGLKIPGSLSSSEAKDRIDQDRTIIVRGDKKGKIDVQREVLSGTALWIIGRPIPINRITARELDRLPGIGPSLARSILEYREAHGGFSSLDELKNVKGIKEKTFQKIKDYFRL